MFNNLAYIILLMVIIVLLFLRKSLDSKQKRVVSRIICLCLIVFSGFRFCVGTDFKGYSDTFDKIISMGRYYEIELGYYWLVQFVHSIGGTAQLVFLIFSFATLYFIYKFIEYFSENVEISWLIFICIGPYFLSTFNGIRQWLVTAIFAYSLRFVKENKLIKYLIINAISCLFHYSAVILLPLYWLLKIKNFNLVKIIICYIVFQIASLLGVLDFIAQKLHATAYLMGAAAFELDWSYYLFFALALGFIVMQSINPKIIGDNYMFKNLNALSGLTVFLAITTVNLSNMIFTRFNMYFFVGYIILIPLFISHLKDKKLKQFVVIMVCLCSVAYYFYVTATAADLTPYLMNFKLFE